MVALIQRPAPAFKSTAVIEGLFEEISLSDYLGKWVVFFFYPMDFTFVCPTEILAFNDALDEFKKIDTVVIGASTDSQYSHFAWATQPRKEGGLGPDLKLPLLADRSMSIARDYGVLLEDEGIALRGLFIIDPKGILRQITVNDLPVGRSVDETLRLVKAFQYTDKYGEVCPADWSEGGKTIKTDPTAKIEYFSTTGDATSQPSKKRPRTE
ncbi:thioredoxin-like protein [Lentinula edodes]|uniref:Thioredoxin-like protein n=2 Tax=Lentinula TaxID=5352 RepID=A0ACC1TYN5_9AGAR|nr:thioredoxin-like protein [Lentinula edodes]KAJ3809897.1 thioredoxin-like protein [Lentinula aff. lateritia]KAJ3853505.1 thioredoxin-like protein [Lentinula lateritia]KAH7874832.1 thioredoxin-like protein [Lentinula edodes]KAJ3877107.1 thioredoxin-like protein [Lentinula edodes]KAJ3892321.1 thioredoxin-like protein [Lentinula edodes]